MEERFETPAPAVGGAAGLTGGAVALASTALLHTLLPSVPFPVVAVGEAVVRASPGALSTFFIEQLGHSALPLTVVGTFAGFLLLSWWLGRRLPWVAARLPGGALAGATALGLVPYLLAVALLRDSSQTVARPTYAAVLVPAFALSAWSTATRYGRLAAREPTPDGSPGRAHALADPGRREVVRGLWVGTAALALGWASLGRLLYRRPDPGRLPLEVRELTPAELPTLAPGDAAFEDIPGLAPELTPTEDHYVVDEEIIDPDVDLETWTLTVDGGVERPRSIPYDELLAMPVVERIVTMECISNVVGGDLISTARWAGIPLSKVLERAGLRDGAAEVVVRAVGGYSDSIAVEQAMLPTTLLAIGMNGRTLPRAHGFPARLLVPGLYGMKQPKWVEAIEVTDRPYQGYWELRGWSKAAIVKTMSRIDAVASQGERFVVAGVAFAGDRGIRRVEVSPDGGTTWEEADLKTPLSRFSWRLWRHSLEIGEGTHEVGVRATDGEGKVQTQQVARPHPDGSSGWHSTRVSAG